MNGLATDSLGITLSGMPRWQMGKKPLDESIGARD